ncbi:MAG: hypothetical protein GY805_32290 [Chloroflexi bacterium]|nr:hypothetical protein [Chloroflexota bacterium]
MNGRKPKNLLTLLNKYFDDADLRELAATLGVDYQNLIGESKRARLLSLIQHAERHNMSDELVALVIEERPFLRQELGGLVETEEPTRRQAAGESFWERMSFGTKVTIVSIIVTIISIIIALIGFFPEVIFGNPATVFPTSVNKILLQVQVNSAVDQLPIANATVRLDVAGQLFSPQRTDSNGRAVFDLPVGISSDLARLTVEFTGFEIETQNITLESEPMLFEFQLRPLP